MSRCSEDHGGRLARFAVSVDRVLFACSVPCLSSFLLNEIRDLLVAFCIFALSYQFCFAVSESVVSPKSILKQSWKYLYSSADPSSCPIKSPCNKMGDHFFMYKAAQNSRNR